MFKGYILEAIKLVRYVCNEVPTWLTEYGVRSFDRLFVREDDERPKEFRKRLVSGIGSLFRESCTHPFFELRNITPDRYVTYLLTYRGTGGKRFMSKSFYCNKRAALFHIFWCHNRIGYDHAINREIGNLMRGFMRQVAAGAPTRRRAWQQPNQDNQENQEGQGNYAVEGFANEGEDDDGDGTSKVGKEPMSVEFFKELCRWLLNYCTSDGVFAYCYLVLTWNLACRLGITARIKFRDVLWTQLFDLFAKHFAHSMTNPTGEESKYPRHIYANPLNPIVCPLVALGLYLTSCFNTVQNNNGKLFPGAFQESRFAGLFSRVVNENWDQVSAMGYKRSEVGTHSIRMGAVSYIESLPGGPPAASVCIRAGWTMGKVKDVYMRYVTSSDQFVGRSLCLLSVLKCDFGVSPPHFRSEELEWIEQARTLQFPMIARVDHLKNLTRMCLASVLFHSEWLSSVININHVFFTSSHCHCTNSIINQRGNIIISYPWNDINNNAFSGISSFCGINTTDCFGSKLTTTISRRFY
jgi:hypothetical protein